MVELSGALVPCRRCWHLSCAAVPEFWHGLSVGVPSRMAVRARAVRSSGIGRFDLRHGSAVRWSASRGGIGVCGRPFVSEKVAEGCVVAGSVRRVDLGSLHPRDLAGLTPLARATPPGWPSSSPHVTGKSWTWIVHGEFPSTPLRATARSGRVERIGDSRSPASMNRDSQVVRCWTSGLRHS